MLAASQAPGCSALEFVQDWECHEQVQRVSSTLFALLCAAACSAEPSWSAPRLLRTTIRQANLGAHLDYAPLDSALVAQNWTCGHLIASIFFA
jgi:hypothetical protein